MNKMTRSEAIEIARAAAKAKPQSYYAEPFEPHVFGHRGDAAMILVLFLDGLLVTSLKALAVIAVATIDRVVHSSGPDDVVLDEDGSVALGLGDQRRWFFGPVGYVLRDVRALATPVPWLTQAVSL
jgi:hypothetical protein